MDDHKPSRPHEYFRLAKVNDTAIEEETATTCIRCKEGMTMLVKTQQTWLPKLLVQLTFALYKKSDAP